MKHIAFWVALALATSAHAATFTVTKEADDDGPCSPDDCALREAVIAANELPGEDLIMLPGGTYRLTLEGPHEHASRTGDLDISDAVIIQGDPSSPATIVGMGDRVLEMLEGADFTLSDLILTGGSGQFGAGIQTIVNTGTIIRCSIHGNTASLIGGGIYHAIGSLTLIDSTVHNNHAGQEAGGIYRFGFSSPSFYAPLTLINSTVSGNTAGFGAGVYSKGWGDFTLQNSSIVGNTASGNGDAIFFDSSRPLITTNSVFEGDCGAVAGIPMHTSFGGNVQGPDGDCFLPHESDRSHVPDLMLGPLVSRGALPPVHIPLPGSPLVDSAVEGRCEDLDQLGNPRPVDGDLDGEARCDVGAVELIPAVPVVEVPIDSWALTLFSSLLALIAVGFLARKP